MKEHTAGAVILYLVIAMLASIAWDCTCSDHKKDTFLLFVLIILIKILDSLAKFSLQLVP